MANIITIIFSLLLGVTNPSNDISQEALQTPLTTYYLIRHAEKDRSNPADHNPNLDKSGEMRAQKWAAVLKDIDFNAVYSTNYNRTLQTAKPLADNNELNVLLYDPVKLFDCDFEKATSGKTVLVVGHSNTTPQFVNAILGKKKYENIDDSENGALFIVQILPDGTSTSQVLYIN